MMDSHWDKFKSHLFQHKLKMLFAKNPQSFVPNPALSYQYFGKAAASIQTEEDNQTPGSGTSFWVLEAERVNPQLSCSRTVSGQPAQLQVTGLLPT